MNTVYFSICLCFQFFLSVCYSFLRTGVLLPLVRFISVYFVLFDAVVTGIIVLISLSDSFLLVYGNATDFYIVYFVSYNFSEFIFGQIHFWCLFCCSVAQSCLTLCDPMDCSMPGFPVLHHLPELAQTPLHWVGDAIQPSLPMLSPSPPASYLSQHKGLF